MQPQDQQSYAVLVPVERRAQHRRRVYQGVSISFQNESCASRGILRNVNGLGGFIQLADGMLVPNTFSMVNEMEGYKIECRIIYRRQNKAGVQFCSAPRSVSKLRKQVVQIAPTTAGG